MASVTRNPHTSLTIEPKVDTRLLHARQLWMISENASPRIINYLLPGDRLDRENALLEIDDYISPTADALPNSIKKIIYTKLFTNPPCHDIEGCDCFIKSTWLNKSDQLGVSDSREVKIWRSDKVATTYWKEARMPGLIRLVANPDDEVSRRSLYVSPIYVTCPADTENAALMTENEINGFNRAYVETALRLSRLFKTNITWTQVLLDSNVEEREFIPINPIEVNEALDPASLKALGGMFALSKADPTCDGFVASTQRAAIQKRPPQEPLDGEEFEIVDYPGSDDQATGSDVVDPAEG